MAKDDTALTDTSHVRSVAQGQALCNPLRSSDFMSTPRVQLEIWVKLSPRERAEPFS